MSRKKSTRSANGRSSVYKGKDGWWHGWVTAGVKDDGTLDRRHRMGSTKAEVTRKVRELERAREEGNVTKPGTSWTIQQWTEHWLHNIASATTGDRGWDAYFYAAKHIVKHVGAHRLPNLLPDHLETMYRKMQQRRPQLAPRTRSTARFAQLSTKRSGEVT